MQKQQKKYDLFYYCLTVGRIYWLLAGNEVTKPQN